MISYATGLVSGYHLTEDLTMADRQVAAGWAGSERHHFTTLRIYPWDSFGTPPGRTTRGRTRPCLRAGRAHGAWRARAGPSPAAAWPPPACWRSTTPCRQHTFYSLNFLLQTMQILLFFLHTPYSSKWRPKVACSIKYSPERMRRKRVVFGWGWGQVGALRDHDPSPKSRTHGRRLSVLRYPLCFLLYEKYIWWSSIMHEMSMPWQLARVHSEVAPHQTSRIFSVRTDENKLRNEFYCPFSYMSATWITYQVWGSRSPPSCWHRNENTASRGKPFGSWNELWSGCSTTCEDFHQHHTHGLKSRPLHR